MLFKVNSWHDVNDTETRRQSDKATKEKGEKVTAPCPALHALSPAPFKVNFWHDVNDKETRRQGEKEKREKDTLMLNPRVPNSPDPLVFS